MSHIGKIIKRYRNSLNMSQASLSENICSEKYVYYIEKGKRTPSAKLIRLFSNRLGVDLFDYFEYLDCINPIEVRKIMKKIAMCQHEGDFYKEKEILDIAVQLPDFSRRPWVYEIEVGRLSYAIFVQHRYDEAIPALNDLLKSIEPKYLNDINMANIYVLLLISYQLTDDWINAKKALLSAQDIICNKEKIIKHAHIIISVKISTMAMHYSSGEFQECIQIGNELLQYQNEINVLERSFYSHFFLAFSYYKTGVYKEAVEQFKKGIYLLLIADKPMDGQYIFSQDAFGVLLNDSSISRDVVSEFKDKYNIS